MDLDPIQYPTVQIDGQPVEVKYRIGDIIRLKKEKDIDLLQQSDQAKVEAQLRGADALVHTMTLLSYGIAHATKKTAEDLYDAFDLADLPVLTAAIRDSIIKASSRAQQLLPVATDSKPN